ncbi:MAG: hypothetical protein ABDH28_03265 [Brevinematia bacterium]
MRKTMVVFLIGLLILVGSAVSQAEDIKIYLGPSTMFFSDPVSIGAVLGADIGVGSTTFSPSDTISVSPELSFSFSQTERSYFSHISLKFAFSYNAMVFSFEKKNNLFLKVGIATGISLMNASLGAISLSEIGLITEPILALSYNFSREFWIGFELRYCILNDLNNRITSSFSPSISVPFAIQF